MFVVDPQWLKSWNPDEKWTKNWHNGKGPAPFLDNTKKRNLLLKFENHYKKFVKRENISFPPENSFLSAPIRLIDRREFVKSFITPFFTEQLIGEQKIAFIYDQTRGECQYVIILEVTDDCNLLSEPNSPPKTKDIACKDELAILYLLSRWDEYERYRKELNDQKYYNVSLVFNATSPLMVRTKSSATQKETEIYAIASQTKISSSGINRVVSGMTPSDAFLSYLEKMGRKDVHEFRNAGFTVSPYTDGYEYSGGVAKILADMALVSTIVARGVRDSVEQYENSNDKKTLKMSEIYDGERWERFVSFILPERIVRADVHPKQANAPQKNYYTIEEAPPRFTIKENVDVGYLLSNSDNIMQEISLAVRSVHQPSTCMKSFWIVIIGLFHQLTHLLAGYQRDPNDFYSPDSNTSFIHVHVKRFYRTFSWLIGIGVDQKVLPLEFRDVDVLHLHSLLYLPQRYLTRCVPARSNSYLEEYYLKDPNVPSLKEIILEGRGVDRGRYDYGVDPRFEESDVLIEQERHLWKRNYLALSKPTIEKVFTPSGEIIAGPTNNFLDEWYESKTLNNKTEINYLIHNKTETLSNLESFEKNVKKKTITA